MSGVTERKSVKVKVPRGTAKRAAGVSAAAKAKRAAGMAEARAKRAARSVMELKAFRSASGAVELTDTTNLTLLNGLPQGTDVSERDGNLITLKGLLLQVLFKTQAANAKSSIVRVTVVLDMQSNGNAMTAAEMWANSADGAVVSTRNIDNLKRFRVLADDLLQVQCHNATTTVGWHQAVYRRYFNNIKGVKCHYNQAAATIAAITSGALWLLVQSTDDGAAGANLTFEYDDLLRFWG